jgi:hypothetical protein
MKSNWLGWSIIALKFTAAPKSAPPAGTPPITPGSSVRVMRSLTRSSRAIAATLSARPMPRLMTLFGNNSSAARRAMIFFSSSGSGLVRGSIGTRISPAKAG